MANVGLGFGKAQSLAPWEVLLGVCIGSQRRVFSWDLEVGFWEISLERQADGAHMSSVCLSFGEGRQGEHGVYLSLVLENDPEEYDVKKRRRRRREALYTP